ncbi:hypothetical protein [Haladaptatus sp. DJG-WS-42]|uniref:DUF7573 domain-containing protein n=1 Tax=Haladaptatus sp. DJG-WS-42 TaxID=3120516 RepID=UPI0030D559B3
MSEDSTLDAFAGSESADEAEEPDPKATTETVTPATATYTWSPDGAACESCGEVVKRRWRDGDVLVCESCKSW